VAGWTAYLFFRHVEGLEIAAFWYLAVAVPSTLLFSAHMGAILLRKIWGPQIGFHEPEHS